MRVAIDTNALYTSQAGIARYIRGLLKGFRVGPGLGANCTEIAWRVENFEYLQPRRALKTLYRELFWMKFIAPGILAREAPDVFHSTAGVWISPPKSTRHVATLHDLAVVRQPRRFRNWHRRSALRCIRAVSNADRVICISRFTAGEAMQLLGLPSEKIVVVHNGCDFHAVESPPEEGRPDFHVPPEFFLFVGSLEPGKNLALLRDAYRLAEERKDRLPPLLIVGARWEGTADEGPPPADWHYLGRQPDALLVYLYRRALALVFPSKYEGFGFPVAEAMALSCPVICSPVASLSEVAGDAACYADQNPASFLDAMRRIGKDNNLRQEMIGRGNVQASRFSWKTCAVETARVYRAALNV
jgi:glycosyltransferase involved in cell wall biosynthesis